MKNDLSAANTQSRRAFIRNSSLFVASGTVAGGLNIARVAHAYGDDTIRIGLVGCGRRGRSATSQALNTDGPTKLVAVADAFNDRIHATLRGFSRHGDKIDVPKERQFVGLDAYLGVLQCDVDLVILTTPPGFRPLHFEAAVNAGKHVFMEKPVAVDSPGVRRVLEAAKIAKQQGLAVAVGLQRRHEARYQETIKRIQDGMIGDVVLLRVYWNSGSVSTTERRNTQTELEFQLRNWYRFNWLGGDHIVEQHVHNLDVGNWLKNGYPISASGQGGRVVRQGEARGQVYDYHFVEFTFADDCKMYSQCRHVQDCWNSVAEHAHGTKGSADISGAVIRAADGQKLWNFGKGGGGGHQQEFHDLFADLRRGNPPNEGEFGAMSTLTAILGRMATYAGNSVSMAEAMASQHTWSSLDTSLSLAKSPPESWDVQPPIV